MMLFAVPMTPSPTEITYFSHHIIVVMDILKYHIRHHYFESTVAIRLAIRIDNYLMD